MSIRGNSDRCWYCGSSEITADRSHYVCERCGYPQRQLEADPGFVPRNSFQIRPEIGMSNDLGSQIQWSRDPSSERIRRLHNRASSRTLRFIDEIIGEVVAACGQNSISLQAADFLLAVNSQSPIGRIRRGMRGTRGMGRHESRSYRAKVYAAATLHILRSQGQANTAHMVSANWGINHFDLVGSIRLLNRLSRRHQAHTEGQRDPTYLRIERLNRESREIRQFLHQILPMQTVVVISEAQIQILRDSGEPFYHGDPWHNNRFTNEEPVKAAFMSTVEAMAEMDLPFSSVQELYELHPVRGLKTRVERSKRYFAKGASGR